MTLEERLTALATDAFPPTPDLAAAWAGKTTSEVGLTAQRRRAEWLRGRWLPVILVALLVPATAAAVIALRPEHITIVRVQTLPPIVPGTATPDLGDEVETVAEASRQAAFGVQALPREPLSVRVLGDLVTLIYPDVVITETPAREEHNFLLKLLGPDTEAQQVREGYFFSGAPHAVGYLRPDGNFDQLPPRLAGNTLAIERDGLIIRIEGEDLTLARALQLSQQLSRRS